jgi:hypothetical protein
MADAYTALATEQTGVARHHPGDGDLVEDGWHGGG